MHPRCVSSLLVLLFSCLPCLAKPHSTPPEIWAEYDPDAGDWKEEIVHESVMDGILNREPMSALGSGGRLKMGHSIVLPKEDTPLGNLWVTLLQQAGVQVDSLGSSTGILPELLA
jgi:hypothetical protein